MNLSYEQSSSLEVKEDFELWKELRLCRAKNKALLNKLNVLNAASKGGDHHG